MPVKELLVNKLTNNKTTKLIINQLQLCGSFMRINALPQNYSGLDKIISTQNHLENQDISNTSSQDLKAESRVLFADFQRIINQHYRGATVGNTPQNKGIKYPFSTNNKTAFV